MQACAIIHTEHPSSSNTAEDQEFPALVKLDKRHKVSAVVDSRLPAYHPAKVTEVVEIPCDQRRYQNEDSQSIGKRYDAQNKICSEIVRETGVEISLNNSKSNVLTVVLSGHPHKVAQAKQRVLAELRQQDTIKITVPHEYHAYLIGRRGERLKELQAGTMTRISIPPANSPDPDTIVISGPKQGIQEAEQLIKETVERQSQQGFERLDIPRIYHPFICGPNNERIDELRKRTDTKISMPPRGGTGTVVTISGKREGVLQAASEIRAIHEQALLTKTIPVRVKRSQHHLVFGPRGSGLAAILAATGVSVELPSDPVDENIILRGRPEDLGRALSMVFERAESSIIEEVPAPNRFHKLLIGKRGAALTELREGYERVNIDFGSNQDKIGVEGPPEEVGIIVQRLKTRIAELEATMARESIRVDPKYFRHIIGRQGATVLRLCEHNVQIHLPSLERGDNLAADEVVIEGNPAGVVKAKAEIEQMVQKLENEKCKDMIIEPRIQQLLCTGYKGAPPPMRLIYDTFPKVSVLWPSNQPNDEPSHENPSKSVVQLRGDRQQVDAAAERLNKLIKQVIEENHREEIRIFKEFRPHIFGRGSTKIQKLLDETQTRIQYPNPSDGSDVFTIIGREENVQKAIRQLEELQKKLANIKEVIVSIPSALTAKFVGGQAPSLRSICDQCVGVHMRFLNARQKNVRNTSQVEVVMLGPSEALEKAQELIDQLNAKVAQLCSEELVHVDPKFHGFLIGRQGANITRFREKHNVELLFPDRMETDPKLAMEIRIVGSKDAVAKAKEDLNALIKSIEDEIEHTVPVDPSLLRDIVNYRRAFPQPELERVRVIMPKSITRPSTAQDTEMGTVEPIGIKLVGQKACVESATQALQSLMSDIVESTTKEFALADPNQFIVLDRARSQFRDMERNHHVFIQLRRTVTDAPQADPEDSSRLPEKSQDSVTSFAPPSGHLIITGRPERIDMVYEEEIRPLLPVEEEFPVPREFHRSLITVPMPERDRQRRAAANAQPKQTVRTSEAVEETGTQETQSKAAEIKQKHGVLIRLPPPQMMDTHVVVLRGTPGQLSAAKSDLTEWLEQCEALKADRIARSYELSVLVPTRFIPQLVQLRPKLTAAHEVGMRFGVDVPAPGANAPASAKPEQSVNGVAVARPAGTDDDDDASAEETPTPDPAPLPQSEHDSPAHTINGVVEERMSTVIFRGYQAKTEAAKAELESTIAKFQAHMTENLHIPAQVHSYLIGSRGYAIQKVMQEYNVRIEFPNRNARESGDPNTVLVTGDEQDVDRACDYLIARANDLMDRLDSESRSNKSRQYREELNWAN